MSVADNSVPEGGRARELYHGQSQLEVDSYKYLEDGGLLQRWSCTIDYDNNDYKDSVTEIFLLRFSSSGGVRWDFKKIGKNNFSPLI